MDIIVFLINASFIAIGLTFIICIIGWIVGLISAFINSK